MDGASELLRRIIAFSIRATKVIIIVWHVPVGTPVALQLARVCIDNSNPLIEVSIGEIDFVGFRVNAKFCNPTVAVLRMTVTLKNTPSVSFSNLSSTMCAEGLPWFGMGNGCKTIRFFDSGGQDVVLEAQDFL